MARTRSETREKRKQEPMGIEIDCGNKKKSKAGDDGGIGDLPDDVLIGILCRLSLKEASRVSVLACRWRYLWRFAHGILRFDCRDTATGDAMEGGKFESWVNRVVELHQGRYIEGMIVNFDSGGESSSSHTPFSCLRSLRLVRVCVEDELVHYFLAKCSDLEELCIRSSQLTMNLRVVDPPRLRVLEISRCLNIQCVEVSALNLVSLSYGGKEKSLKLKSVPNLRELTISGNFCRSFVLKPEDHRSYSDQLEKLVLDFQLLNSTRIIIAPSQLPQLCSLKRMEVQVTTKARNNLLYIPALLEASPQLCEIRIEMFHTTYPSRIDNDRLLFRIRQAEAAKRCFHRKIKVVEVAGYIGCPDDNALVLEVMKIGHGSIERVVIDTQSAYYDDPMLDTHMAIHRSVREKYGVTRNLGQSTRNEARKVAQALVSKFPRRIKSVVT